MERTQADRTLARSAAGDDRTEQLTAVVDTWPPAWEQRRVVVQSLAQARTADTAWRTRLARAQAALDDLTVRRRGKARIADLTLAQALVDGLTFARRSTPARSSRRSHV